MEFIRKKNNLIIILIVLFAIINCGGSVIHQNPHKHAENGIQSGINWKWKAASASDGANTVYPGSPTRWGGSGEAPGDVFRAFWNLPNSCGDKFGIDVPLSEYGIEFNSNHNWTHGDVLTLFDKHLGFYPHYENITGKMVAFNGGIPQVCVY